MTTPDWTQAPEGATHYSNREDVEFRWHTKIGGSFYFWSLGKWQSYAHVQNEQSLELEPRPSAPDEQETEGHVNFRGGDGGGGDLTSMKLGERKNVTVKLNDDEFQFCEGGRDPSPLTTPPSKYHRQVHGVWLDVYDILTAYGVTNPADAHAIKKMLMPGQRGAKDGIKDRREAIASIERAIRIEEEGQ